jgi:hypothetical protein
VTDTATRLIWLKDATCLGPAIWANAKTAAAGLRGDVDPPVCNLTDGSGPNRWRLPTRVEWEDTIHTAVNVLACADPSLTTNNGNACFDATPTGPGELQHAFVNVLAEAYWSSTEDDPPPSPPDDENAFVVLLNTGDTATSLPKNAFAKVWPVREP